MISKMTRFKWAYTRMIRGLLKALFFYPVMLVCLIPYWIYTTCLIAIDRLDYWWWE